MFEMRQKATLNTCYWFAVSALLLATFDQNSSYIRVTQLYISYILK